MLPEIQLNKWETHIGSPMDLEKRIFLRQTRKNGNVTDYEAILWANADGYTPKKVLKMIQHNIGSTCIIVQFKINIKFYIWDYNQQKHIIIHQEDIPNKIDDAFLNRALLRFKLEEKDATYSNK